MEITRDMPDSVSKYLINQDTNRQLLEETIAKTKQVSLILYAAYLQNLPDEAIPEGITSLTYPQIAKLLELDTTSYAQEIAELASLVDKLPDLYCLEESMAVLAKLKQSGRSIDILSAYKSVRTLGRQLANIRTKPKTYRASYREVMEVTQAWLIVQVGDLVKTFRDDGKPDKEIAKTKLISYLGFSKRNLPKPSTSNSQRKVYFDLSHTVNKDIGALTAEDLSALRALVKTRDTKQLLPVIVKLNQLAQAKVAAKKHKAKVV